MKYDEVWSYPVDRIKEFFDTIESNCNIEMEALEERRVGPLSFPQTRIVIEGDDAEDVYHLFYLHFISGGA